MGWPLRFIVTSGAVHDSTQAAALLDGYHSEFVIADKGYDAEDIRALSASLGAVPVIPERSNRKQPQWWDRHLFKERHAIECCINKLKRFNRLATRREKLAARFLGFVHLIATHLWLR